MKIKFLSATAVMAWPAAKIAIMNPCGAVDILRRRELAACGTQAEQPGAPRHVCDLSSRAGARQLDLRGPQVPWPRLAGVRGDPRVRPFPIGGGLRMTFQREET
jgi:hypothetical protein